MSRKKRRQTGECVYCGKIGPITDDHIPPKNLFAAPRPGNLIKVPSCPECHGQNKEVSKDDEYFRLMLTLREDTFNHPDVEKILPTVFRSLEKPDKVGFAKSLMKTTRQVQVRTPSGLYLGIKPSYDVNLTRLDNVARRIAKGLFYHETGHRLPDRYDVVAYSDSGLRNVNDTYRQHLETTVIRPLVSNAPKIIGDQVFIYWAGYTSEDINKSAWLFVFYERVAFLCLTLLKEEMVRAT